MFELPIVGATQAVPPDSEISGRCPHCRDRAVFVATATSDLYLQDSGNRAGLRRCPQAECRRLVFFVGNPTGQILALFPQESLDFDTSGLPEPVLTAIREAVICHSTGCYNASALMVRKTLELLCEERGADGATLGERLKSLRQVVILPTELMDGMNHIRLLGNDAAHVESRVYSDVGREEVELALEVTKEVLKGVYQYDSLVGRLRALQKGTGPTN